MAPLDVTAAFLFLKQWINIRVVWLCVGGLDRARLAYEASALFGRNWAFAAVPVIILALSFFCRRGVEVLEL